MIRRALLSVSDKRGVVELARVLADLGVELLSTGGTAQALADAGIAVVQVSTYTGAPEILDGRVKTLHPKIHGGLLGRPTPEHQAEMAAQGIAAIDLVVVNLYPFQATIARPDVSLADAIENIDIGGPSMLRSAAKNHERVAVVVDPDDYPALIAELQAGAGALTAGRRLALARKAFAHTAAYDGAISDYLGSIDDGAADARHLAPARRALRRRELAVAAAVRSALRREPAPAGGVLRRRQLAAGRRRRRPTLAAAEVLNGKALSYNNILDLDAALGLCLELAEPAAVVIKHNNPCGVATAASCAAAYVRAREADPVSAFGGIVAINREVDEALAEQLVETFLEVRRRARLLRRGAREILGQKKNLRLLAPPGDSTPRAGDPRRWTVRSVAGGVLVQRADTDLRRRAAAARVVTRRAPDRGGAGAISTSRGGSASTSSRTRSSSARTARPSASAPAR